MIFMTQIATVEKVIDNEFAEITVPRKSACGHIVKTAQDVV